MAEAIPMDDWHEYQAEQESEQRRNRDTIWHMLEHLGELPEPELLHSLSGLVSADIDHLQRCWGDLHLDLRRDMARALSTLAEDNFKLDFSAVFMIGLQDSDAEVRTFSVRGLREVEDVRLVPKLTHILRGDPAASVRAVAADALANYVLLGELGKTRPQPFKAAVAALRESYLDAQEAAHVKRAAIRSIAYSGAEGVAELIHDAYEQPDEAMRISAVSAMGRSADQRWAAIIRREISSPDPQMRLEAVRACGELQLRDAVQDIIDLTDDASQDIRLMALWALGQIGGKVARKTLDEFVAGDNLDLQSAARQAIHELEFFQADPASFFGPPADYSGEAEEPWSLTNLSDTDFEDQDEDDDVEWI